MIYKYGFVLKEGYAYRKAGIGRFKLKQISCFFISLKNELLFSCCILSRLNTIKNKLY